MNRLIFGCGYLGQRIAEKWASRGDQVYAVTRNSERASQLKLQNLIPLVADITKPDTLNDLPAVDTILFAVGMDRSRYSDIRQVYVDGLRNVLARLPTPPGHLIYISSTGVYGDFGGDWIDESSPTQPVREGGIACLEAESLIASGPNHPHSTILRFAGIYGPGRVPTQTAIQSGQWKKLSAEGYLNLIHVEDGANLIKTVARTAPSGQVYLVSDGHPPLRSQYYQFVGEHFGIPDIPWDEVQRTSVSGRSGSSKRVSNKKLLTQFEEFQFQFPNYRSGLADALENNQP